MAPRNSAIVGVGAIAIGTVGMYGSLTGRLPAMLAAIFYPQLLSDQSGQSAADVRPGFWSQVGSSIKTFIGDLPHGVIPGAPKSNP